MKIKVDDKTTVYYVTLLLKVIKIEKEGPLEKHSINYDIFTGLQKTAKSIPEAIEMTIEEAKKRKTNFTVVTQSATLLTPEIFFLNK